MPPLTGIRVVDLTRMRAGPAAVRVLGDWGADIVKVETPLGVEDNDPLGGQGRDGGDYQNLHRNKRSITLDLKQDGGRDILLKLADRADVIVENFRPDVKRRLGIEYETLRARNPRLIYASISAFGQDGPYRDRPGFDQIAQGMGGLMSVTGEPGGAPMRVGIAIADVSAGIFCAQGILLALLERHRSGEGQWVTTSLIEAQIAMLDFQAARWLVDGDVPRAVGNDHPTIIPTGVFPTADGHINIAVTGDAMWRKFCSCIGEPGLADEPDYADNAARSRNRASLNARIAARTIAHGSLDWVNRLNEAGIPGGPIYRMDEVFADPQVRHLGMARAIPHPTRGEVSLVAPPVALSRTPCELRSSAPGRGADTDDVLGELGLTPAEIADLRCRKVI